MIKAFAGDPFLARRAASAAVAELRLQAGDGLRRLEEGGRIEELRDAIAQGGLFGRAAVFVDLDQWFSGAGHTAERNAVLDLLATAAEADVVVLDSSATPARQRRWRELGELVMRPTPRYGEQQRWVRQELKDAGLEVEGDVAGTLIDLFGDDLPGIVGEILKLGLLDGVIDPERVRTVAHRPASRTAFDLTDAMASGETSRALQIARGLLEQGEQPVRIMAALCWQIDLIARCAALLMDDPRTQAEAAAKKLGTSPYPTRKALAAARGMSEQRLAALLRRTVDADVAMKTGRDPDWALESCVIELTGAFAKA